MIRILHSPSRHLWSCPALMSINDSLTYAGPMNHTGMHASILAQHHHPCHAAAAARHICYDTSSVIAVQMRNQSARGGPCYYFFSDYSRITAQNVINKKGFSQEKEFTADSCRSSYVIKIETKHKSSVINKSEMKKK